MNTFFLENSMVLLHKWKNLRLILCGEAGVGVGLRKNILLQSRNRSKDHHYSPALAESTMAAFYNYCLVEENNLFAKTL